MQWVCCKPKVNKNKMYRELFGESLTRDISGRMMLFG